MTTYRAFLIDEHGHCVGAKVLHGCETDGDAMAAAKQCVDGCRRSLEGYRSPGCLPRNSGTLAMLLAMRLASSSVRVFTTCRLSE